MRIAAAVVASFLMMSLANAEDWTLTNGTVYHGVTVLSHDDGFVTILDNDGGATVPLKLLPPQLRARFNYDPTRAALAEKAAQDAQAAELKAQLAADQAQAQAQASAQAASTPAMGTPPAVATTAPPPSPKPAGLSDVERQQIQTRIQILNDDIAHMERDLINDHEVSRPGYSTGGFEQKVADDREQIQQLQAQLDGKTPAGTSTGTGSTDIRDAFANVPRL